MTLKVFEDGNILTYRIVQGNVITSTFEEIDGSTRRKNEIIQYTIL